MAGMAYAGWVTWGVFGAVVIGLAAGVIIGQATEYFTSDEYKPTKGIAGQAQQGPATTIIDGLAVGMYSTWIPVVTIVLGIMGSFWAAGGATHFAMGCLRNWFRCRRNAFNFRNYFGNRCFLVL